MFVQDNLLLGLPVFAFVIMFALWWRFGRDPKLGTIIPEYESPQKMIPAEVAGLWESGAFSNRAVSATTIDLAQRGYLHIRYDEPSNVSAKLFNTQQYTFIKKRQNGSELHPVEKRIFDGLFPDGKTETKMEDLAMQAFYRSVADAGEMLWKEFQDQQLFNIRPRSLRAIVSVFWIASLFFVDLAIKTLPPLYVAAVASTFIIVGFFLWSMPRRTEKGAEIYAKIKGFQWFLNVTEKDRLEFHNAPQRTPEQFQALLPFAIALGVEKAWAKQFESITLPPPEWAEGDTPRTWTSSMRYVAGIQLFHAQIMRSGGFSAPSSGG